MLKKARQRRIKVLTIYMKDARPRCEYEGEGGQGGGAACVLAGAFPQAVKNCICLSVAPSPGSAPV